MAELAVARGPRFADAWLTLGEARLARGDRRGALKAYRRAADLAPNWDRPRGRIAVAER